MKFTYRILAGLFITLLVVGSTGCAVYTNGMTLPSPYYYKNTPQYFPKGPTFPFSNEAANLQETDRDFQR